MKTLLFLALIFPALCLGYGVSVTASGGDTIPVAYTADDSSSEVIVCANSNVVQVVNKTASDLAVSFRNAGSAPTADHSFVPAGATDSPTVVYISLKGGIGNNTAVFIRSDSGSAITDGKVKVACWNEEAP